MLPIKTDDAENAALWLGIKRQIIERPHIVASTQEPMKEVEHKPEWDFILPELPDPSSLTPGVAAKVILLNLWIFWGLCNAGGPHPS